jgi:hypothetical protein
MLATFSFPISLRACFTVLLNGKPPVVLSG